MPNKSDLPFFDDVRHKEVIDEEPAEMYVGWSPYRENLILRSSEVDC